jgi:hypothetical protein
MKYQQQHSEYVQLRQSNGELLDRHSFGVQLHSVHFIQIELFRII